ncbi:uncharacterized protein LOC114276892 [Camellia sinensis]|uniref:uncharacterized protein LOC114276892 n=1 Tax=Camellia sinensis TaxID=4442 RepID=UPI001036070A|nr:uncharacterized protein LOC114276892 [Camellia sinensis]
MALNILIVCFRAYLEARGILYQTSCVGTLEQNGVAERKNRHLLEAARALMFTMHVPKPHWGDAVLTATYLINRMPSSVLHFQRPLDLLPCMSIHLVSLLPKPFFPGSSLQGKVSILEEIGFLDSMKEQMSDVLPSQSSLSPVSSSSSPISGNESLFTNSHVPSSDAHIGDRRNKCQMCCQANHLRLQFHHLHLRFQGANGCSQQKVDGTIERYKARLVAEGFTQTYDTDAKEMSKVKAQLSREIEIKDLDPLRCFLGIKIARLERDWTGVKRSTTGYCTFVGGNLVTWRSKKQSVVARSSVEYRAMAHGICELMWLKILLVDLGLLSDGPLQLYCDNKAAINIAHNPF